MANIRPLKTLGVHPSRVSALAYSPGGDSIACGYQDGGVVSWDVATGGSRATYVEHATSSTDFVLSMAYSPDGALLAATNLGYYPARRERAVYIWRTNDKTLAYTLGGFRYQVYALAFTSDGALLAVGGDDSTVELYDVQSGEECGPTLPRLPYSVSSLAFRPHSRLLVAGCDGCEMRLWNLDAGAEERTIEGHVEWTSALAFHPSGSILASGGEDGAIILWDAATAQRIREVRSDNVWGDWVTSLAFNPRGTLLASASAERVVELWDTGTSERVTVVQHAGVRSVVFSPDGALLASGGNDGVKLWQMGQ
jgi:WD40 repeat protein